MIMWFHSLLSESDKFLVDGLKGDYSCPVCKELLTEPFLTDCGHHIMCGTCCERILLKTGKADCPLCREPNMLRSARLNKHFQREVNSLQVHCQHYDKGCEWVGEVRHLQNHLDPEKASCLYVTKMEQSNTCEYCTHSL